MARSRVLVAAVTGLHGVRDMVREKARMDVILGAIVSGLLLVNMALFVVHARNAPLEGEGTL